MTYRVSTLADVPRLKELWFLAFHDQGAYVDHFFSAYCTPDKMLVAEQEGEVVAMTAWYGSTLHRQGEEYRFAYLYAVATHPDQEKKGIASGLLEYVYQYCRALGFHGVTTVPAEPSLHVFFGRNGFQEYFLQQVEEITSCPESSHPKGDAPQLLSPEAYRARRGDFLADYPWIDYDVEGYSYQSGVCALGNGGLFATKDSLCTLEEGEGGVYVVKELLGSADILTALWQDRNPTSFQVRRPTKEGENVMEFGMIQWFSPVPDQWSEDERGFLGLGFD